MATIDDGRSLYFDLLKHCLTDSIYADAPLANFVFYRPKASLPAWKRGAVGMLDSFLACHGKRLVERHSVPWDEGYASLTAAEMKERRDQDRHWPLHALTFLGQKRLDNIQYCVESVLRDKIPGDLIETGVWRGGACILMRAILKAYGDETRIVWLADSFEGLPPPDAANYPADSGDKHHAWSEVFAVSSDEVKANFRRFDLLDHQVRFLEGWFKDTLPTAPIERLAVLRLDGDMYEATMQALEGLYHKLSGGGYVIIDDYYLPACAKAVHDFRSARGIGEEIQDIDGRGCFWRRSF
ncbi:MAG TPA: TylF/MycF/NovP-related O-methyltransferase [Dongiaceae bacterium]|nr:TylF/MycF/NovP-related O-methyltransferase [Dongiaceae bacterium]